MEIFRDIPGYEGLYKISNKGNVYSSYLKENMKLSVTCDGYFRVSLSSENKKKNFFVQRLVAESFIPNVDNKQFVDHIDGNKKNNCVYNLRWVTRQENDSNPVTVLRRKKCHKKGSLAHRYGCCGKLNGKSKPVIQMDKNGNFIAEFESTRMAGKITGVNYRGIANVANGRVGTKTAGGYIWKYK